MPRRQTASAAPVAPRFFTSPAAFRSWLAKYHATRDELLVGFHRKATGKPTLTWPESVDEALSFGWIDGVRRRIDEERYTIRFTPRRAGSNWSAVNLKRIDVLTAEGRMHPAGLAIFAERKTGRTGRYSYEQRHELTFEPVHLARFQADPRAWSFFQAQAPSWQRLSIYRVVTPKLEATRMRRLEKLIAAAHRGEREG